MRLTRFHPIGEARSIRLRWTRRGALRRVASLPEKSTSYGSGRTYRIACATRMSLRKYAVQTETSLIWAKVPCPCSQVARRQARFLHDKITKEESRCIDCRVSVQSGFLCEGCKRQREGDALFDRKYAAWKKQHTGKTFGQWLGGRARGYGE